MRNRWLIRITIVIVAVVACAVTIIPAQSSSRRSASVLTHRIARGELLVTTIEQGTLESSNNTEIKCRVRGNNIITWVIENGTMVQAGETLMKLDTLSIDEQIIERTKFSHLARSAAERSGADVERAKLAILEYEKGRFLSELATLEKDLAIAESKVATARNILRHSKMMVESGYQSELDIEEKEFALAQAELNVQLTHTNIEVLKHFTKKEQLAALVGALNVARARHEADKERALADHQRLLRAKQELEQCVIKARRSGLVIYPRGEDWKNAPIEEGATVHKDQTLLLMPDLTQMQVKVGIHESIVDRIRPGLKAEVTLPGRTFEGDVTLDGVVASVAPVTKPAGWWTGNVVKYDTIVELPSVEGLKPGMSVEVEVIIAQHEDVLLIPTSAVIETAVGHVCWVQTQTGPRRTAIEIGDASDMFIEVRLGLVEGDDVVVDPLANIREAQTEAAAIRSRQSRRTSGEPDETSQSTE